MNESQIARLIKEKLGLELAGVEKAKGHILSITLKKKTPRVWVGSRMVIVNSLSGVITKVSGVINDDCASITLDAKRAVVRCQPDTKPHIPVKLIVRQFYDNKPVVELWFSDDDLIRIESMEEFSFDVPNEKSKKSGEDHYLGG